MLQSVVISKVNQPPPWCAPMAVTPKENGDVRICVDLTKLNKSMLREAYPLPSVDFTLGKLSRSKIFSKMDANIVLFGKESYQSLLVY